MTSSGIVGTSDTTRNLARTIHLKAEERVRRDLPLVSSRIVVTTDKAASRLTATSYGTSKIAVRTAK